MVYLRACLFLFLLLSYSPLAWAKSGVKFYVCAHPDDCMLFMNPNLYDDVTQGSDKVVVIYLTSGDGGKYFSKDGVSYPYVRELASLGATDWMTNIDKTSVNFQRKIEVATIRDHAIDRISYANIVSYFLRLPDGNMDGNGFERYGFQSLKKLKNAEIAGLVPIDGGAAYDGWDDLLEVLLDIVSRETAGEKNIIFHMQDPDTTVNHSDHSDHTVGASGMMEALTRKITEQGIGRCYKIYKHLDYAIAGMPSNLDEVAFQNKSGSFGVLTATQYHFRGSHDWGADHTPYLARNYYTIETLPKSCSQSK